MLGWVRLMADNELYSGGVHVRENGEERVLLELNIVAGHLIGGSKIVKKTSKSSSSPWPSLLIGSNNTKCPAPNYN